MRDVRLKQTGLRVSVIAFGTWAFGGHRGTADVQESKAAVHRALEIGINLFDTAQGYGFGVAERLLGDAIREAAGREDVVLASQGGLRMAGDSVVRDASAGWLRRGVEASLRNLRTDYIDIYQVHWPDPHTPPDETAGVLEELVREGKIRHVGVSDDGVEQLRTFSRFGRLETLQSPYSMFRREIENRILPYTAENDIGVLACGPLAHGLLAGGIRASTAFDPDDWRRKSPGFTGETLRRNLAVVERLQGVAREWGISLPQLAVAWVLANPDVDVAITGARRPSQLDETAAAAKITLDEAALRRIDAILADAAPVSGPRPEGLRGGRRVSRRPCPG
jgi:aryl-alcohol dehydrogenase-like predicted oxidoreductase